MTSTLSIGSQVEIIGPCKHGYREDIGERFIISEIKDGLFSCNGQCWMPASSLQKPAPEEIAMHTGTFEYKKQEIAVGMQKAKESLREILAPLVDERLSAIEKRLDATEEQQGRQLKRMDAQKDAIIEMELSSNVDGGNIADIEEDLDKIFKRLQVLEGERPEVCHCTTETENRVLYIESKHSCQCDCTPPEGQISITIQRGKNEVHGIANSKCPMECLAWCEKVLDSMRKEG